MIKFSSAKEMFDYIGGAEPHDIYNIHSGQFLFAYNDEGSIAVYYLSHEEAASLEKEARLHKDYWGAFLGVGGHIYDMPTHELWKEGSVSALDYCEEYFTQDGWIDCKDVLDVLEATR